MTDTPTKPLTPFVDELPVPRRFVAAEHDRRLTAEVMPKSPPWRSGLRGPPSSGARLLLEEREPELAGAR